MINELRFYPAFAYRFIAPVSDFVSFRVPYSSFLVPAAVSAPVFLRERISYSAASARSPPPMFRNTVVAACSFSVAAAKDHGRLPPVACIYSAPSCMPILLCIDHAKTG